jgi:hypothetical protein
MEGRSDCATALATNAHFVLPFRMVGVWTAVVIKAGRAKNAHACCGILPSPYTLLLCLKPYSFLELLFNSQAQHPKQTVTLPLATLQVVF